MAAFYEDFNEEDAENLKIFFKDLEQELNFKSFGLD